MGTNTTSDNTLVTSHVHNLPPNISAGDLLFVFHFGSATDSSPNTAAPGWTVLKDKLVPSSVGHTAALYKVASGSEGATVTVTTDLAEVTKGIALRITGQHGSSAPEVSTGISATTINPDPDSITASWGAEDNLWIAVIGLDSPAHSVNAYPANMPSHHLAVTDNVAVDIACAVAVSNAATFDPNAFGSTGAVNHTAFTITVRPLIPTGGGQRSNMLGVW